MDISQASDLLRDTLVLALITAAPMLLVGLVVGVLVSLFQTLTQIQEQTLTFIPKIAAMIVVAIIMMPWTAQKLVEYASTMFAGAQ